jgi:hypothetical protein
MLGRFRRRRGDDFIILCQQGGEGGEYLRLVVHDKKGAFIRAH